MGDKRARRAENGILIDLSGTTVYTTQRKGREAPRRAVPREKYTISRFHSMIDTKLLDILACPVCKGDVEYDARNEKIICTECGRKYPVKDGIPVMLVDEAETK